MQPTMAPPIAVRAWRCWRCSINAASTRKAHTSNAFGFTVPARNTAIGGSPTSISGVRRRWRERRAMWNATAMSAAHNAAAVMRYARCVLARPTRRVGMPTAAYQNGGYTAALERVLGSLPVAQFAGCAGLPK